VTEQQPTQEGIFDTKIDYNNSIMVDWTLYCHLRAAKLVILETMISEAVTNRCPNLCQQRNLMQLVLDMV